VLDELGYLDGDTVTPAGQRLTRLYSELDLVAAECLHRGLWEGLNPAELAACVSVLSFESRKQTEDAGPARMPKGPVRDVLTTTVRTWSELDHLEQRNGLSFLREPDPGFVWAAYRWVRGAKLEDVLDSVPGLTPGDFVRSMKQLIDLLDQIAAASRHLGPPPPSLPPEATTRGNAAEPESAPAGPMTGAAGPDGAVTTVPGTDEREPGEREQGAGEPGDRESHESHEAVAAVFGDTAPRDERPSREPAPQRRDVAATARAAIEAMRRGVVAYTTLAD
jgi:hypothetical protein